MILRTSAALMLFLIAWSPQEDKSSGVIAIQGGKIKTMSAGDIDGGVVLIENGRIKAVGKNVAIPAGATVIDAKNKIVIPGMIDSMTHIGLIEIEAVPASRDDEEGTEPVTPHMNVLDGFNPASKVIPVTRMNGITSVVTAPGEANIFSGQSALVHLDGRLTSDMVIKSPLAIHINLGESPKEHYKEKNMVQSRMGIVAKVRETLTKANEYLRKKDEYAQKLKEYQDAEKNPPKDEKDLPAEAKEAAQAGKPKKPSPPDADQKMEALVPALKGEIPVIIRAHRLDDIWTAIKLGEEFQLKIILSHATEGWKIADEIAKRKIPVLVGPINVQPEAPESQGATYENAAILQKAGVKIAIQTNETHHARILPFMAGLTSAYGLPPEEALKAITINPAEIFGVSDQVGSIKPGAWADLVICDGDPLQPRTKIEKLFIRGRDVELRSIQTDLYDQYK